LWQSDAMARQLAGAPQQSAPVGVEPGLGLVIAKLSAALPEERYSSAQAALADVIGRHPVRISGALATQRASVGPGSRVVVALAMIGALGGLAYVFKPGTDSATPRPAPRSRAPVAPLVRSEPPRVEDAGGPVDSAIRPDLGVLAPTPRAELADFGTSGCGKSYEPEPQDPVLMLAPDGYQPERLHPVILIASSRKVDQPELIRAGGWIEVADEANAVLVSPHRFRHQWGDHAATVDLFHDTLETAGSRLCIDRRRIFVVGSDRGGRVARWLAAAPWVTAVAGASGRGGPGARPDWLGSPKPAIWLQPGRSERLPLDDSPSCTGHRFMSHAEHERGWRERNGCRGEPRTTFESKDGVCRAWTCKAAFESCIYDGGIRWPGVAYSHGLVSDCSNEPASNFPAARRVWGFFTSVAPLSLEKSAP
jgi:hypothetical protein